MCPCLPPGPLFWNFLLPPPALFTSTGLSILTRFLFFLSPSLDPPFLVGVLGNSIFPKTVRPLRPSDFARITPLSSAVFPSFFSGALASFFSGVFIIFFSGALASFFSEGFSAAVGVFTSFFSGAFTSFFFSGTFTACLGVEATSFFGSSFLISTFLGSSFFASTFASTFGAGAGVGAVLGSSFFTTGCGLASCLTSTFLGSTGFSSTFFSGGVNF